MHPASPGQHCCLNKTLSYPESEYYFAALVSSGREAAHACGQAEQQEQCLGWEGMRRAGISPQVMPCPQQGHHRVRVTPAGFCILQTLQWHCTRAEVMPPPSKKQFHGWKCPVRCDTGKWVWHKAWELSGVLFLFGIIPARIPCVSTVTRSPWGQSVLPNKTRPFHRTALALLLCQRMHQRADCLNISLVTVWVIRTGHT